MCVNCKYDDPVNYRACSIANDCQEKRNRQLDQGRANSDRVLTLITIKHKVLNH